MKDYFNILAGFFSGALLAKNWQRVKPYVVLGAEQVQDSMKHALHRLREQQSLSVQRKRRKIVRRHRIVAPPLPTRAKTNATARPRPPVPNPRAQGQLPPRPMVGSTDAGKKPTPSFWEKIGLKM